MPLKVQNYKTNKQTDKSIELKNVPNCQKYTPVRGFVVQRMVSLK